MASKAQSVGALTQMCIKANKLYFQTFARNQMLQSYIMAIAKITCIHNYRQGDDSQYYLLIADANLKRSKIYGSMYNKPIKCSTNNTGSTSRQLPETCLYIISTC